MTDIRAHSRAVPAGRREWLGLAVLALPALLASLELTVTYLALPAIGEDLAASSTQQLWIVDVYAFLLAGSLITVGGLGDRIGPRRLLLIGSAAYGVASVLAAYAPSPELLIAARAAMGLAAATLMPSVFALVAGMFQVRAQRAVAISLVVSSVAAGTAVGPLVGGWLLDRYWWGSAFLLALPFMAAVLIAGPVVLPDPRSAARTRLDVISAVLSLAAVLPTIYGLKRIAVDGVEPAAILAVVAGLAFGAGFVARQRRSEQPLVDLRLFAIGDFRGAIIVLALGIFVLWSANFTAAQYLQLVHDLSPLTAGLWTAPSALGVIAGSTLAPRLARRFPPGAVIAAGMLLAAVGFAVLTRVESLPVLLVAMVVVAAGLGPMMALATGLMLDAAPPEQAGMTSALSSAVPQLGGAVGIAVLGSVIAAVYRDRMSTPPGLPDAARDNLAGAVAADLDPRVLDTAREAFTSGFHLTAGLSAVVVVGLAVVIRRAGTRQTVEEPRG